MLDTFFSAVILATPRFWCRIPFFRPLFWRRHDFVLDALLSAVIFATPRFCGENRFFGRYFDYVTTFLGGEYYACGLTKYPCQARHHRGCPRILFLAVVYWARQDFVLDPFFSAVSLATPRQLWVEETCLRFQQMPIPSPSQYRMPLLSCDPAVVYKTCQDFVLDTFFFDRYFGSVAIRITVTGRCWRFFCVPCIEYEFTAVIAKGAGFGKGT